jgi:xanthine dehydrogenase accessory factor
MALNEALEHNQPVVLATVVDVQGASPAQVGFKLLVRTDGCAVGNVGGGRLEQRVREEATAALRDGRSRLFHSTLREEGPDALGTLCGGDVTFFIEAYNPIPTLLIVGGGHLGRPLAEMARIVGLHVQVVDVQPERATVPQFDPAAITPWTYVVIITQTHVTDEQTLRQVLDTPAAYVGMIGSRRKVQTIFDHLRADGVPEEQLARVHAPIGLDLGGRSPEEIALGILAEVVQVRCAGSGRPRALLEQDN